MELNIFEADHLLKIGLSALFFTFIDRFGAVPLSRAFVPAYSTFKPYQVTQWNSRVAAIINAVIVCPVALWLLFDPVLLHAPVTGVTQGSNDLCRFAAGYFLWDLFMCFFYFNDYGIGFTMHAIFCLYTYLSHLVGPTSSPPRHCINCARALPCPPLVSVLGGTDARRGNVFAVPPPSPLTFPFRKLLYTWPSN